MMVCGRFDDFDMLSPDRKAFLKSAESGSTLIPVACSWPADLETQLTTWPVSYTHLTLPTIYSV